MYEDVRREPIAALPASSNHEGAIFVKWREKRLAENEGITRFILPISLYQSLKFHYGASKRKLRRHNPRKTTMTAIFTTQLHHRHLIMSILLISLTHFTKKLSTMWVIFSFLIAAKPFSYIRYIAYNYINNIRQKFLLIAIVIGVCWVTIFETLSSTDDSC